MSPELSLVSSFLVGLLGSTHCLGMCGGIVGALTLSVRDDVRRSPFGLLPYLLAYNTGRLAAYTLAGAAAGWLGATLLGATVPQAARLITRVVAGGFMIALGLYLSGWWVGLTRLEQWGARLWRRIEPYGRKLLPVRHPASALGLGFVWGWLPCGMVYSVLAWSLAAGSASAGASLMLAFGLGTLPMLLALGAAARWLAGITREPWVRRSAGLAVMLFGLGVWVFGFPGHGEHASHAPAAHAQHH